MYKFFYKILNQNKFYLSMFYEFLRILAITLKSANLFLQFLRMFE